MNPVTCVPHSFVAPPKPHILLSTPRASSSYSAVTEAPRAVVIGAGLSGLAAGLRLTSASVPFVLLEASDAPGGRVRTDHADGFLLDRGFQILLTAYPEARRLLNLPSLRPRPFFPGALVFHSGRLHRVADPLRAPLPALASLLNPIGSPLDKALLFLAALRAAVVPASILLSAPETSIAAHLATVGLSPAIVDRFLRPFIAGIFFDPALATSSRLFDFVFKYFALGDNALPADGIGAVPTHLAARLPPGSLRLRSKVLAVDSGGARQSPAVTLESGETIAADLGIILAVEQPEAEKLLPQSLPPKPENQKNVVRSTVCIYFSADRAPTRDPILILNGSGEGIVNNMCYPTNVAPSYGPEGKTLASVSLVGDYSGRSDEDLAAEVVQELGRWFGPDQVGSWRHLRTYRIGFAQPDQTPPTKFLSKNPRVQERVYVCGDHWGSATFDGALVSGRRAAEALIKDRGLS